MSRQYNSKLDGNHWFYDHQVESCPICASERVYVTNVGKVCLNCKAILERRNE